MISRFFVLVLVVFYCLAPTTRGQECVASSVQNLRIFANATLSWTVDENEECEITEFQIDILGDLGDEFHFKVLNAYVDLSFMEICEEWQFTVTPISDGVLGFERRLTDYIPLPPNADLSLSYFNVTGITSRDVLLEWDLTTHVHGDCTLRYRVTIEDEDRGDSLDLYVTGRSMHLHFLSPCVSYQLIIRAVNRAHPTIEGPRINTFYEVQPEPENVPSLSAIEIGATGINMSYSLENPGRNRCPIRTLYVDGGRYFNLSLPLQDSDDRPPVSVNLGGLQPGSMYYMKVSIQNSGGVSQAFPIAVQTLELSPGRKETENSVIY